LELFDKFYSVLTLNTPKSINYYDLHAAYPAFVLHHIFVLHQISSGFEYKM